MLESLLLSILNIKGFGPKFLFRFKDIIVEKEQESSTVLEAISAIFEATNRINKVSISEIDAGIDKAEKIINNCNELSIEPVSFLDDRFPKNIIDQSELWPIIYCVGNIELLNNYSVGIIGTKNPDEHGKIISNRIGDFCTDYEINLILLQQKGIVEEVMNTFDFTNVEVLASGIDLKYDPLHDIYTDDMKCVVSPFPPGVITDDYKYIEASKVVACLSNRVILIQDSPSDDTRFVLSYFSRMPRTLGIIKPIQSALKYPINSGNLLLINEGREGVIKYCRAKDVNVDTVKCTFKELQSKADYPQFFGEEELPF
ncbi:DNA-processing protein DprA [Flammeovirga kamogawensis]|uniref:DNA-processing protein DprA n=1 Tax=Flammeovirga kamogawensis TaxID=373891 RepID=A0ABX8H191_9BACT|nr:DNA-processing protein DprA [Flammeovirga kamogawensis]MBB6462656.1 putative Rossmann fold nucleotide-binding protein DprA/Smf involved in DNA uptake [Flammeovirga kamogawensis]QWG09600.1 DNA-processing protein DprA [Flammeovirga kamogawensis]TRX65115.1 hypothetical protein EO216_21540 [Flammeovirga kamogawensis]